MKPDRFEKMAEQEYERWLYGDMLQPGWLQVSQRCMKRQHAAYMRLVKSQERDCTKVLKIVGKHDAHGQGMLDGVRAVLGALARYRKWTR
jgi:hypothetical protein